MVRESVRESVGRRHAKMGSKGSNLISSRNHDWFGKHQFHQFIHARRMGGAIYGRPAAPLDKQLPVLGNAWTARGLRLKDFYISEVPAHPYTRDDESVKRENGPRFHFKHNPTKSMVFFFCGVDRVR